MTKEQREKFVAWVNEHRVPQNELNHNGFHAITPIHLMDTIMSAKEELDYSNYDNANLDRLLEVLFRYCELTDTPFGSELPLTFWKQISLTKTATSARMTT